jgi:hypothetical protein
MSYLRSQLAKPAVAAFVSVFALALVATAGSLTPPGAVGSTMFRLSTIWGVIASDSYDSSGVVADANGSLLAILKEIDSSIVPSGWTDGGGAVYLTTSSDVVGIGTDTPGTSGGLKLDVSGDILASGSGYVSLRLNSTNGTGFRIRSAGVNNRLEILEGLAGSNVLMSLQSGGVGIGGVLTPTEQLEVLGEVKVDSSLGVGGCIRYSGTQLQYSDDCSVYSSFASLVSPWTGTGSNVYLITSTNNVGIGDATPEAKFEVVGAASVSSLTVNGAAITPSGWTDGGSSVYLTTSTDSVGIGDATPETRLEVTGTASISTLLVNGMSPVLAGTLDTPGFALDMYVSGRYAYVADFASGFRIIDITIPTAPVLVGSYDTPGLGYSVQVIGRYAYVADGGTGLLILDISNPTAPTLVGSYNTGGDAGGLYISGKYAYIADGYAGLTIVDISNPAAPSLVGSYDTPDYAYNVWVSGGYAYVGDNTSGLQIINVANPAAPVLTGTYNTAGYALSVHVSGKYAYIADGTNGLVVVNISNPATPTLVGSLAGSYAWDLYVSGKYAYIANDTVGLKVVDISNPAVPALAGTYNTSSYASGVFVSGRYAYVADYSSGLVVVDLGGADTPVLLTGNISTGGLTVTENTDIGNNLYVRNGFSVGSGGSYVQGYSTFASSSWFGSHVSVSGNFELSGTVSSHLVPTVHDTYDLGSSALRWRDLYLASGSLHIGTSGDEAVIDYNVNDDYLAFKPNGTTTSVRFPDLDTNVSRIVIPGASCITDSGCGGFEIQYGATPTAFRIGPTSDNANIMFRNWDVVSGFVFHTGSDQSILTGAGNLGIGNLSPEQRITVLGNILASTSGNVDLILNSTTSDDTKFTIRSVGASDRLDILGSASQNYVTILKGGNVGIGTAAPTSKLQVVGSVLTSEQNPVQVASISSGQYINDIEVVGRYAYVGNATSTQIRIYDITNPASPSSVGVITGCMSAPSNTLGHLDASGGILAAQCSGGVLNTVKLYDISNPSSPQLLSTISPAGYIWDPVISGKYLYIAQDFGGGISVYDISDPRAPILRQHYTAVTGRPLGLALQGNYLYNVEFDSARLNIYDISNPTDIVKVAYSVTSAGSSLTGPHGVSVFGRYAFVGGNQGVKIYDISNPASPSAVSLISIGSFTTRTYVSNRYLYAAAQDGIHVYDISNIASPVSVGFTAYSAVAYPSMELSGKYAFVAGGSAGFKVFDISGIDAPGISGGSFAFTSGDVLGMLSAGQIDARTGLNVWGSLHSFGGASIYASSSVTPAFRITQGAPVGGNILELWASTSQKLTVTSSGNVGIASSSPEAKLTVRGDFLLRGRMAQGNRAVIGLSSAFDDYYSGDPYTIVSLMDELVGGNADEFTIGSAFTLTASPTNGDSINNPVGVSALVVSSPDSGGSIGRLNGVDSAVINYNAGAGAPGTMAALNSLTRNATDASVDLFGLDLSVEQSDTSAPGDSWGAKITANGGVGITTGMSIVVGGDGTTYGLYVQPQTTDEALIDSSYGIYITNLQNYFQGRVGIGNAQVPDALLHVASITFDGGIVHLEDFDGDCSLNPEVGTLTTTCPSDERLKKDIEDKENALEYLAGFRIRDYTVRVSGERKTGVIAQELMETRPELVTMTDSGLLAVEQPNPYVIIKAIQEQQAMIEALRAGAANSTPIQLLAEDDSTLLNRIVALFSELLGIEFSKDRVKVQELCLEDICVNRDQLLQLLDSSNLLEASESEPADDTSDADATDEGGEATPTEPAVAPEGGAVEEEAHPIEEPATETTTPVVDEGESTAPENGSSGEPL